MNAPKKSGTRRFRRPWLAAGEGLVDVSAIAGAVSLAVGSIDFGAVVTARLPFDSPVLAGIALAAIVGVPMAVRSIEAPRGTDRANALALTAGGLLVVWIVVEVCVIRSFSWLQPVLLAGGAAIAFSGYRRMAPDRELSQ
jgi:hypothetical protein